jgi:hypothetical protein
MIILVTASFLAAAVIYGGKLFEILTPWANVVKLFVAIIYECS